MMQKVPAGQSCESPPSAVHEDKAPPQACLSVSALKPKQQKIRQSRLTKEPLGP